MKTKKKVITTIVMLLILTVILAMIYFVYMKKINKVVNLDTVSTGTVGLEEKNEVDVATTSTSGTAKLVDTKDWDLTKVDIVYDTEGIPVPVPKGFRASNVAGEHTVQDGFVIYSGTDPVTSKDESAPATYGNEAWKASTERNQWVWVPVEDTTKIFTFDGDKYENTQSTSDINSGTIFSSFPYRVLGFTDKEAERRKYLMDEVSAQRILNDAYIKFEETCKSVEKYGGFYIGRYESYATIDNKTIPKVTRAQQNLCFLDANIFKFENYIEEASSVETGLLLWNFAMYTKDWMINSRDYSSKRVDTLGEKIMANCVGYRSTTIDYVDEAGNKHSIIPGNEMFPSGCSEDTRINNIYDLTGNARDCFGGGVDGTVVSFRGLARPWTTSSTTGWYEDTVARYMMIIK